MPIVYQTIQAVEPATFEGLAQIVGEPAVTEDGSKVIAVRDGVVRGQGVADGIVIVTATPAGRARLIGEAVITEDALNTIAVRDGVIRGQGVADGAVINPPHINDGYIESTKTSSSNWDLTAYFDMFDSEEAVAFPTGYLTDSGATAPNEILTPRDETPTSQGNGEFRFNFSWSQSVINDPETYNLWLTGGRPMDGFYEGWETQDWGGWQNTASSVVDISTTSVRGEYSGRLNSNNSSTTIAGPTRDVSGGLHSYQPRWFRFRWRESSNSFGAGVRLRDESGNPIVGFATDNPQWIIYSGNGETQVYDPGSYDQWVWVSFWMDWANDEAYYYINGFSNVEQGTVPLNGSTNVGEIDVQRYSGGFLTSSTSSKVDYYLDDMALLREAEDFERTNVWSQWADVPAFAAESTTEKLGEKSGYLQKTGTSAAMPDRSITERKYDIVEWYYRETSASQGGGIRLFDNSGNFVAGVATNNPQVWVHDDSGGTKVFDPSFPSNYYGVFLRITIRFDWASGTFSVDGVVGNVDSTGFSIGGTADGIGKVSIDRYNNGWLTTSTASDIDMWFEGVLWASAKEVTTESIVDAEQITIGHPINTGETSSNSKIFNDTQETSP